MKIKIVRKIFTAYGVHGTLYVNDTKECETLEHPSRHLRTGSYRLTLKMVPKLSDQELVVKGCALNLVVKGSAFIQPGNGPFTLKNGSIIVGKPIVADNIIVTGLLSKSQETYNLLYDKVKECMENGEEIEVEITKEEENEVEISTEEENGEENGEENEEENEEENGEENEDVEDENVVKMIREGEEGR